jgi:acetoin utilization protein AcuB
MKVHEWASPDPETCLPSTTIGAARRTLYDLHIRHLPVVDEDDTLVGILSDRDLFTPHLDDDAEVAEIMSTNLHTTTADESLSDAAMRMLSENINALPVVDGARIVGVITTTDCLMALMEATRQAKSG